MAQERAEIMIRELVAGLGGPAAERVRHDLALAIGLWAAIARATGRKEAAASAYACAFELIAEPKDREAEAILRSRASYLLIDLGHPGFAFSFLNAAADHFLVSFNRERYGTCLVDRAVALIKQGDFNQAEAALQTALELVPVSEWRYRVAAYHNLALCSEHRHSLAEARNFLSLSAREFGERRDSLLGQLYWFQGRLALSDNCHDAAAAAFSMASSILSELGHPFEGELALLDVAEIAAIRSKMTELQQLGREFLGRVAKNSHNRVVKDALIRLANTLLFGTSQESAPALALCREKMRAEGMFYLAPTHTNR